ncbi:MAG: MoaD/ThiS family protein [Candidatus Bathyarchaeia archaeon]|nr:MoaD/ThiS family protein [Candidatus Bathyarchaeota archaeon]
MKVFVEFIGYLARKIGRGWLWVEVCEGDDLRDLFLKRLSSWLEVDIARSLLDAFIRGEVRIAVNGRIVWDLDLKLSDGDRILLFPLAAGGCSLSIGS